MTFPIGSTVPLPVTVVGTDGTTLVDPSTLVITVTKPDGSAVSTYTYPATITRNSLGKFQANHTITLKGLHGWSAVTPGPAATYGPDSFTGADPALVPVVGLAEVREQLRSNTAAADAQLLRWAVQATLLAEQFTHLIWSTRSFTDKHADGKPTLSLFNLPVQSVTTVIEDGATLAVGSYTLDDFGILSRGPLVGRGFGAGQYWLSPTGPIRVTYVAGPDLGVVDENIRLGVLEMCQHLAMPTRGGSGAPRGVSADTVWAPGMTYPIPRRVAGFWSGSKGAGI
jgi:hypothetical protein